MAQFRTEGSERIRPAFAAASNGGRWQRATMVESKENQTAVAVYIAELCSGLIDMAEAAEFNMLAYLLDMARLEAEMVSNSREEPLSGEQTAIGR